MKDTISVEPGFSFARKSRSNYRTWPTVASSKYHMQTRSGRQAFYYSLGQAGVNSEHTVLMPAYLCPSMFKPLNALGVKHRYYYLNDFLQPDISRLESCYDKSVKVLLVAHYFGRIQDLSYLRSWCDDKKITLIEDCAHAFYGKSVGVIGDFGIASPRKFFPIADGGLLLSRKPFKINRGSSRIHYQVKSAWNMLEKLWLGSRTDTDANDDMKFDPGTETYSDPRFSFERSENTMSLVSRLYLSRVDVAWAASIRRKNFLHLLSELQGMVGMSSFWPSLMDNEVPYAFPVILRNPDRSYKAIRRTSIAAYRWNGHVESDCEASEYLRHHLVQLPCHQGLTNEKLADMINRLASTLS